MPPQSKISTNTAIKIGMLIVGIVLSVIAGSFLYYVVGAYIVINSLSILAIICLQFILAIFLNIKYIHIAYVSMIILGMILVSVYPFGQGLIIVLLITFVYKILRIS